MSTSVQLGRFCLPLSNRTPKVARDLAASVACAWSLEDITDHLKVLVSEIATNAFVHGSATKDGAVVLEMARIDEQVHVTLFDGSRTLPGPRRARDDEESGRGLKLVEEMTDDSGWYETPGGKAVWFAIDAKWPESP